MGFLDDLFKRAKASADAAVDSGRETAGELADEAKRQAARAAAEQAAKEALEVAGRVADEALDDIEKHLVGDLDEVQANDAALDKRARARMAQNEADRKAFHQERLARKDRAAAELEELKKKLGKS